MLPHSKPVLEEVELLPDEDQEVLVGLIQQRLAARRRAEIAANIAETRAEYKAGTVRAGNCALDLMAELDELRTVVWGRSFTASLSSMNLKRRPELR